MPSPLDGAYHTLSAELIRHVAHPDYVALLQRLQLLAQREIARVMASRPCLPGCGMSDPPAQPARTDPAADNSAPPPG
jgi:hypothetical protein